VVPWTDPEPRLASSGVDEVLESFDKVRGKFTFRSVKGPREVSAAELPMIEFPAAEASGSKPSAGFVMAAFHGGARVLGRIVEITEQGLRLDCPALADPLVCQFGQLAEIEPLARRAAGPLPGRPGTLEADAGRMLGCLANAPGSAGGIAWQLQGAVKPVPINADTPLRISYQRIAGPGGVGVASAGQATVYLKTGDSITCTVVSADPAGLRIRTEFAGETVVTAVALRAVEVVPWATGRVRKAGSIGLPGLAIRPNAIVRGFSNVNGCCTRSISTTTASPRRITRWSGRVNSVTHPASLSANQASPRSSVPSHR